MHVIAATGERTRSKTYRRMLRPIFVNKAVLITATNRGIGAGLVNDALKRAVKQVYAAMQVSVPHADPSVKPVTLNVTNGEQTAARLLESTTSIWSSTTPP